MTDKNLLIDYGLLIEQMDAVQKSDMPEKYKSGVCHLLGHLRDLLDEYNDDEILIRKGR